MLGIFRRRWSPKTDGETVSSMVNNLSAARSSLAALGLSLVTLIPSVLVGGCKSKSPEKNLDSSGVVSTSNSEDGKDGPADNPPISLQDFAETMSTDHYKVDINNCRRLVAMTLPEKSPYKGNFSPNKGNFSPEEYTPPSSASIWYSHIVDPTAKTIIYIPDHHAYHNSEVGAKVQRDIFDTVESAIQEYGHVPLVWEAEIGLSEDPSNQYLKGLLLNQWDDFASLALIEDEEERRSRALQKVGQKNIASSVPYLSAVFQKGLTVLPSESKNEYWKIKFFNSGNFNQLIDRNVRCDLVTHLTH